MKQFLLQRWFLIALVAALVVGIMLATPLEPISQVGVVRNGIVAVVLFLMALPLEAGAMWRSIRRPWAPLVAYGVNFGLLPLFAWIVSLSLSREMAFGLFVAATTPCTLASASVWTRRAGGNDSVAILVTIATNLTCFVVTPLWLLVMTGQMLESETLQFTRMASKLGQLVVFPMVLAQLLRIFRPVGWWATRHKTALGVTAQCGVLTMIFIGAVQTGLGLAGSAGSAGFAAEIVGMIVAVLVVHMAMLFAGMALAFLLGLSRADRIAVGFAGSQKTLMVGLQVGMDLGFTILPMVSFHVGQLIVDTIIADQLRRRSEPS